MIIVGIDYLQPEGLGIPGTLVLADLIFLSREYVRIAVIDHRGDSVLKQGFDDCR